MIVEKIIQSSGLNYTILNPVQFADNVGSPFFPIQPNGLIKGFVDSDAKVPYIACRDIGLTVKAVLRQLQIYNGKSIRLLGDVISGDELAVIVTRLRGETFRYRTAVPHFVMRLFAKEFYFMRLSFESFGRDEAQQAQAKNDMAYLKTIVPELSSMEDHLKREGWASKVLISNEEKERQEKLKNLARLALVTVGVATAAVAVGMKKRKP
jgi:uncharacterized protein YbjT (DUF2867 family)